MIDRIIGNKSLPIGIRHDIIERTDGIPLFVEEMTKAVLEAEDDADAHRHRSVPSPGCSRKLARLVNGAARPARPRQRGGADRSGDRPRVLPCSAGRCGAQTEAELELALDRILVAGLLFRAGRTATCYLSV